MNDHIKPYCDHLEYLGYNIREPDDEAGRKNGFIFAFHPSNYSIVLRAAGYFINFFTTIDTDRIPSVKADVVINRANEVMNVCRVYYVVRDSLMKIKFEGAYTGEYQKQAFGAFMDAYLKDHQLFKDVATKIGDPFIGKDEIPVS